MPARSQQPSRDIDFAEIDNLLPGGQLEAASLVGPRALLAVVSETALLGSEKVRGVARAGGQRRPTPRLHESS